MTAPHEVGDTLPKLYTIKHAAERWVYRRVDSGELHAAERGRGVPLRITAKSLHSYLESVGA